MPSNCACGESLPDMSNGDLEACGSCGRIIVESQDGTFAHQGGRVSIEKAEAKITVWCPDCREERERWEVAKKVRAHARPQRAMFKDGEQEHLDALESKGVIASETRSPDGVRQYTVYEYIGPNKPPEPDETIGEWWESEDIPDSCTCDECGCEIDVDT